MPNPADDEVSSADFEESTAKQRGQASVGFQGEAGAAVKQVATVTTGGGAGVPLRIFLWCGVLFLDAYQPIWIDFNTSTKGFDFGGFYLNVNIVTVLIALTIVYINSELRVMFGPGWIGKCGLYALPGLGFSFVNYINIATLSFITFDMRTVFHQFRLPLTALLSGCILGRKHSATEWILLCVVTLAGACYTAVVYLERGNGAALTQSTTDILIGFVLSFIAVLVFNVVGIFMQKFMQDERDTPFYIQKFYMEILGGVFFLSIFSLFGPDLLVTLFSWALRQIVDESRQNAVAGKLAGMKSQWVYDPGSNGRYWDPVMLGLVALTLLKLWCGGFMVKQLSHLEKTLCQSATIVTALIAKSVHKCEGQKGIQMCPTNIFKIPSSEWLAVLLVMFAVLAAIFAGTDKKCRDDLQKELAETRQLLLDKKWHSKTGTA